MSEYYFVHQVIVILLLFATGMLFNYMISLLCDCADKEQLYRVILAYPTGLSIWALIGFVLLLTGIPYGLLSIAVSYFMIYGILFVVVLSKKKQPVFTAKTAVILLLALLLAVFCCSGILRISVSNDSYYYYSVYPQTIAIEGSYLRSFDVFLTDVGQTTAIIGTLPWFFGFEETFGIQLFLGFNLVLIFAAAVYFAALLKMGKRGAYILTLAATLILFCATPFVVMTRWVLANVYFMSFLFLLFVFTIRLQERTEIFLKRDCILIFIYTAMLSMIRMEGGMMACLLILSAISLAEIKNRQLLLYYLLPVALTQIFYYINLYLVLKVDPLYSFLNYTNVFIQLGFIAVIFIYVQFFRNEKFEVLNRFYSVLLLGGLLAGNVFLAVISPERYLGNLRFFMLNILKQNGWGYFAFFVLAALLLLPVKQFDLRRVQIKFSLLFTLGFVFFTVAVCWARNGTLRVGIGDSGNRVLMQVVPFAVYTVVELLMSYIDDKEE